MASLVSQTQHPVVEADKICANANKDENFLLIPVRVGIMNNGTFIPKGIKFTEDFYKMVYLRDIECQDDDRCRTSGTEKFAERIAKLCILTRTHEGATPFIKLLTTPIFDDKIYEKSGCKEMLQQTPALLEIWRIFSELESGLTQRLQKLGVDSTLEQMKIAMNNNMIRGLSEFIRNIESDPAAFSQFLVMDVGRFKQKIKDRNSRRGVTGGEASAKRRSEEKELEGHFYGSDIREAWPGEKKGASAMGAAARQGEVNVVSGTNTKWSKWWGSITTEAKDYLTQTLKNNPNDIKSAISQVIVKEGSPDGQKDITDGEVNYISNLILDSDSIRRGGGKRKRKKKTKKKRRRKKKSKKKRGRRKKSKKNRRKKKKSRRKRR